MNRVPAGRLHQIAEVLGVEVSYFFEGLGRPGLVAPPPREMRMVRLARNFAALPPALQAALLDLARAMSDAAAVNAGRDDSTQA